MGDEAVTKKGLDKRVAWVKSYVELSLSKKGDKKFDKGFLAEENVVKVKPNPCRDHSVLHVLGRRLILLPRVPCCAWVV